MEIIKSIFALTGLSACARSELVPARETTPRPVSSGQLLVTLVYLLWSGAIVIGAVDTHYVSLDGTNDSGNGYITWAGAATQIQWAVDKAAASDTVLVSNGTYNLTNQISITANITVKSLYGTNDAALLAIINGNYPLYTNRCVSMTTGKLGGFTISNGFACSPNSGGGVAVSGGALVSNCFIYRNFCSNDLANSGGGGGLWVGTAGTIVSNCSIISNIVYQGTNLTYSSSGGGVAIMWGGLVADCYISGNISYRNGGGGYAYGSPDGIFSNCTVVGNWAGSSGGGIHLQSRLARNCVISNNVCASGGGGVGMTDGRLFDSIVINNVAGDGGGIGTGYSPLISNCLVSANTASNGTGGISLYGYWGIGTVLNCIIVSNVSIAGGPAGLMVYGRPSAGYPQLVKSCLIYGNTNLGGDKGGVYLEGTSNYPYGLINCTIVSNQSATKGGGIYAKGTENYIENCIVYFNVTTNDNYDDIYNNTAANTNNYWHTCMPTNLVLNQGNITNDPLFIDQVNRNYRLSDNSPCVNAGTNQSWMTNSVDLDQRTRIRYGTVDMGAYELIISGTIYGFR